jgi:hypothetical protein
MSLSRGISVEWNTPQGPTHGMIVEMKTAVCDGRLDDMRVRSVSAGRGLVLLKSIVVGRVRNAGHALLSGPGVFRGGVPVP